MVSKKKSGLSVEQKIDLMAEYIETTGNRLTAKTEYKGIKIGVMRSNIRYEFYRNNLKISDEYLEKALQYGILRDSPERVKASVQEKYNFLIEMDRKSPKERSRSRMANGVRYFEVKRYLQRKYEKGELNLRKEEIQVLIEKGILKLFGDDRKKLIEKYGVEEKYAIELEKQYGSREAYMKAVKNNPKASLSLFPANKCPHYVGAIGIVTSSNAISIGEKKLYFDLVHTICHKFHIFEETLTGNYYIDLDNLQKAMSKLREVERKCLSYYFGLIDGELHTHKEIDEMLFGGARKSCNYTFLALKNLSKDFDKIVVDIEEIKREKIYYQALAFELEKLINMDISPNISPRLYSLEELKEVYINDIDFSTRAYTCLWRNNIVSLYDLMQKTHGELLRSKGLGIKTLCEIEDCLQKYGGRLRRPGEAENSSHLRLILYRNFSVYDLPLNKTRMIEVDKLGFSNKVVNGLIQNNILSMYDLLNVRRRDLRKLKNFGQQSYMTVTAFIERYAKRRKEILGLRHYDFDSFNIEYLIKRRDESKELMLDRKRKLKLYITYKRFFRSQEDIFNPDFRIPPINELLNVQ